jgi:hypothetical protein
MRYDLVCNQTPLSYPWLDNYGGPDQLPTPIQPVDMAVYLEQITEALPISIEHRLMDIEGEKCVVRIEWYDDCAFALVLPPNPNDGSVRYMRVGSQWDLLRKRTRNFR